MYSKIWITAVLGLSACVSFENVKATAKLGQALGAQPVAVSDWIAECEAVHATRNDAALEKTCLAKDRHYETMVATVRDASALLKAYADALQAAADDKDVKVGDDVTSVLTQVGKLNTDRVKKALPLVYNLANVVATDQALAGKLTTSGVVAIVDTIVRFASQSYRRAGIEIAVRDAAPHVDALAAFVEAEVSLHLEDVVETRDALANEVSARPETETTPAVAQMLPLVAASLDARIAQLRQLVATCQSFRMSHAKLAQRIKDGRPWQQKEMLAEIRADIELIVGKLNPAPAAAAATTTTTTAARTTP
jgi:ribosomal protein L11